MKKIRIGLAGFGDRGYSFAIPLQQERFSSRAEIAAVYDPEPLKLEFARQAIGYPVKLCSSIGELLDSGVDLVMVTTPQFAHAEVSVAALNAGIDVFTEKPMARNVAECRAMLEAERKSGKRLFMGFNMRHHPVCAEITRLIESGRTGRVQQQTCLDFYAGGFSYFRRWHRFAENSGGLTVEKGCHSIDLLNLFSGSDPLRVTALGGRERFNPDPEGAEYCSECKKRNSCVYYFDFRKGQEQTRINTGIDPVVIDGGKRLDLCPFNSQKDTFDNVSLIVEYANKSRAVLQECFTSSVRQTNDREFILNCWNGQIWGSLNTRKIRFYENTPGGSGKSPCEEIDIPPTPGHHGGADPCMLDHMLGCLAENRPDTLMRPEAGLRAVAVAQAAEIAIRERRVVELENL